MHYFSTKSSKIAKRWGFSDVGDLNLHDLAKLMIQHTFKAFLFSTLLNQFIQNSIRN